MFQDAALDLLLLSILANGLLVGASLDQSIKQLPARRRIGPVAFSTYSRAADLGSGIWWYALLGIGTAVVTIVTMIVILRSAVSLPVVPAVLAILGTILHTLATTQAAPTNFAQRKVADDPDALNRIFDKFERWQTLRAVLQD